MKYTNLWMFSSLWLQLLTNYTFMLLNLASEELVPIAAPDYVLTRQNQAVVVDVFRNDIDPDQPGLSGQAALRISEFTNGDKGMVELVTDYGYDALRYTPNLDECGGDLFTYTIQDDDQGYTDVDTVYVTIDCPVTPSNDYNRDNEKRKKIDDIDEEFGHVLCKSDNERADNIKSRDEFCIDIEYEAVCNTEKCAILKGKIIGREELVNSRLKPYENMYDEVSFEYDESSDTIIMAYRKGECEGQFVHHVEIEYDSDNECISKWTDYLDDITITDKDGSIECDNSIAKCLEKLETECEYEDDYNEKKRKRLDETDEQLSHVISEQDDETTYDSKTRQELCVDHEYQGICTTPKCDMFGGNVKGREAVLRMFNDVFENLYEEAEMSVEDGMLIVEYRKGECEGTYIQRVDIEYDLENDCILKWINYLDDVTITDKNGNVICDNSLNKFMDKIANECQFDDETDINEYIEERYIYMIIDEGVTFEEARDLCIDRGSDLASITSTDELDIAYEIIDQNYDDSSQAWIGLYSETTLRNVGFSFADGSECVLNLPRCIPWWVEDKPLNIAANGSKCANLSPRLINNDIQCEQKLKGVLCNTMENM